MAFDVDAASAGPTRQLRVLPPRRQFGVRFTVVLDQTFEHHRACRHVDAEGQRLGREDRPHEPLDEQFLDCLAECRQHAGMVRCQSAS